MNIIYLLDLIGTAAFAASGARGGMRKHMDLFRVLVLGAVTAVGTVITIRLLTIHYNWSLPKS